MSQYAQGDTSAFESLYQKHKGGLYRYFVRQIGDIQLAEDLYQETWGRVIKAAASYETSAKFTTWLYRIAHNLLIDHVRAVKPVDLFSEAFNEDQDVDSFLPSDTQTPDTQFEEGVKAKLLKHCISLLPTVQKEALLLNMEAGFTAGVISEVVGISLEASKSRIRYANQSLKTCVMNKWQEVENER
ncbi:sigma-70 family RNA polymerase sigma factor [Shewanella sp. D64]|uniref:sigma-70 family RNA polymerase sigma factor n=1 Tax=unclassified Shewanella TaxID=196818 RepID=UPI0022BA597E|nr:MULTISPECIES: sigma-70 family RNA polymerase sigma factor [unclassified Shewanella]MEC4727017.1 sigma-70 family RNA polymerase sigma factor [Shewanella sp. D64]MEC4737756.1 sigma-70 family RNA polymerase sigma factor [Shewanella sp. E94]WBJ98226.1 sigma-70 family RNA polymerase sigma factor [Shewanella sp. MTB7]